MASIAFPYELYSAIIHFATYSPVCFNISPPQSWPVSYYNGAYQADYKTKKALTLVSRQFRSLSLPVLYEAVEVHKVSSIQRLADVLDTTSPGSTTRGPQNPRKIKHLCCRHLLGFGFYSTWLHYTDRYSKPRNWLMSIPKSLPPPCVSLPKLTHFSIPEDREDRDVQCNWHMPSLTHLHVNGVLNDAFAGIIKRARDSLRCLVLGYQSMSQLVPQVLNVARNLEEFTYHFCGSMNLSWKTVETHPSLQHIVVIIEVGWVRGKYSRLSTPTLCAHLQPLTKEKFPKLCISNGGLDIPSDSNQKSDVLLDTTVDTWSTSGIEVRFLHS
ncbi:hypothetical protein BD410DRAFT_830485 [Rickenella mellea]|uniref:F-box domain-containing protein n=1 Tax=Rickenella mellea TaxID=50990 RepID=A0A4Y7PVZ1_9AGAM|nr:hypothetical protein BD410DRAFT_830485 [Rickenella mellea]